MRPQKVPFGAFSMVSLLLCFQGVVFLAKSYLSEQGICNTAGPFGLPANFWLWNTLFLLAGLFFLIEWWRESQPLYAFLWLLLLAAGGSNALERFFSRCVFDFLGFPFGPLFNVADVALFISVVFLLWREIRKGMNHPV